jgi:hypothetical protein
LEVVIKELKYKVLDQCIIRVNGVKLAAKVEGIKYDDDRAKEKRDMMCYH